MIYIGLDLLGNRSTHVCTNLESGRDAATWQDIIQLHMWRSLSCS